MPPGPFFAFAMAAPDPVRAGTARSTAGASVGMTTPVPVSGWDSPAGSGSAIGWGDGISNIPLGAFQPGDPVDAGDGLGVAAGVGLGLAVGAGDAVGAEA